MTAPAVPATTDRRTPYLERLLAVRISLSVEVLVIASIIALAVALRFWDLGARALHHDESIHAKFSWDLVRGNYRHDPVFHGPLYYHVQGLVFFLFGASDYTARVAAALFGSGLVLLPLALRRRFGPAGTIAAVAFIAFSPTILYYSRFFREDIFMAFFTMLSAVAIWRYIDEGRDRWLIIFALSVTGSFATKEATYLSVAILLVFLDVYLAARLVTHTLEDRGQNTTLRRTVLTICLTPYAWAIAALWPFLGGIKRSAAWERLPRAGDLLVLLGTLTLPLLLPFSKGVLERIGIADPGQLDYPAVCNAGVNVAENRAILGGAFLFVIGAAAFVGLNWRPRTWAIAAGSSAMLYLTLVTSFWTNFDGLCTGPWGSLDYWLSQQDVFRGDQPWFYYYMLMPAYEFLPLVIAIGGAWWAIVRGNAFSRFLVFWVAATWLSLSWAGEKMPWLNTHIALPTALLAAWTVQRAWDAWRRSGRTLDRDAAIRFASIALVAGGAMLAIAYLPGGAAANLARAVVALFAGAFAVALARPWGRSGIGAVAVVAVVGALAFFSLRTMIQVSYVTGDVPEDMLIYTQSSPDIPRLASDIDRLAAVTGKGYDMPIAVDSRDSMSWPWAWYLRDYRNVNYSDFENNIPDPAGFDVILVNQSDLSAFQDKLSASAAATRFASPEKYPHRWWFDERYKAAMAVDGSCTASSGDCGPFVPRIKLGGGHLRLGEPNLDAWKKLWNGVRSGWLESWLLYIRDHERSGGSEWPRCRSCGSINAFAYFPATFDRATGMVTAQPLEPPPPTVDPEGRPTFGGLGSLPGQFFHPVDIESDAEGNLYVIDSSTKLLQKFDSEGNYLAGVDVRTNEGGNFADSEPWGLAIAPDGRIVVADTFGWRIRVFSPELQPLATFGQPYSGGTPGPFDLFGPRDAVVDDSGQVWVTDTGNDRIVVYTLDGEFVKEIGASGSGPGQFDEPVGLARDAAGEIYVADMYNSRVVVLSADGSYLREFHVDGWGGTDVNDKPYIEALSDGRLAVGLPLGAEVRIYSGQGELLSTIAPADDRLNQPYGLTETADGRIWIVEGGSARVRLFDIP